MTIKERVKSIINNGVEMEDGYTPASIEKMIYMAYFMGRESATKEVCDIYSKRVSEMRSRANKSRYYKYGNKIIGGEENNIIYHGDYSGDFTYTFGSDVSDIVTEK